ncbi:hypothetical protein SDC9_53202 [bioreactor metagenome]|uniref:DUF5050 domain-containing protein n=1 Tax=bioreactor metagenome TaxID=1076179 RepID=A0A644WT57_9ZZZZ|nr:hypothetical protein [Oscillospiraceae bacterium]
MKTKTLTKITSLLILSLLLFSCTPQTPYLSEEESKTGSQNTSGKFEYYDNGDTSKGVKGNFSPIGVVDDNFLYTTLNTVYSGNCMRYDIRTGTIKNACADPVCTHDSEKCPLYWIGGSIKFASNGIIGIGKTEGFGLQSVTNYCTYNTINNKLCQIYNASVGSSMYESDDYYYFADKLLKKGGDYNNKEDYKNNLIRVRKRDLQSINLGECNDIVAFADKDKIFFYTSTNRIYYTDIDMKNEVELVPPSTVSIGQMSLYGDDLYYSATMRDENGVYYGSTLNKINIITKYNSLIAEKLSEYTLTSNYIYYEPYTNEETGAFRIDEETVEKIPVIIHLTGEIFRCDHNGDEKILIYSNNDNYLGHMLIEGNYIFAWTYIIDRKNEKFTDKILDIACLDIHNKEWWYIKE